jgi:nitroimidazol reductase NimA-like FMN-containing flavoprotein (pyridoxamine 5'-phosphate oxidase superfamily)
MSHVDEPLFEDRDGQADPAARPAARERIRRLLEEQPFGVLCVQGGGQPYGALVALAFSRDLRHAAFATARATRKYRLLSECDHVALVVDSRPSLGNRLMDVEAVTATGRAERLERGNDFDRWARLLVARHPYLESFVKAETCALFRIDVVRFLHVMRFQEVHQWIPTDPS